MRFSWLIAPLLAVTLVPRLMAGPSVAAEDRPRALADTVRMLELRGFTAQIETRDGPDAVLAAKDDCRLAVSAGPSADKGLDLFRQRYGKSRNVSLFYRDGFVTAPPRLRPLIDYYGYRHFSPLGLARSYPPLVMIAASGRCDIGAVPWHLLRLHPRAS
ncbi:hypothetical protein [Erythrobacter neustonensis]|uniref:Uncharacterized protein n=1 Tax=Erythrobacter neustonensis TaxID=1112 RepID=A0A192D0X1_9SPHN|nr:hypothetical protein [Erythrobacter neustonensis]ANK12158.1 hypothetical protein A9D12_03525 [Erythrobacter neustonensis]